MSHQNGEMSDGIVQSVNASGASSVVLVCEHASHFIPERFDHLGLLPELHQSHVAWDPGAFGVAQRLSDRLDAALIAGGVSRLVYDCNRPPEAPDAMPARSEVVDIPGNAHLSVIDRAERVARYYEPFRSAVASQIARTNAPVLVTIHSFTPTFHGKTRPVEIGVLHDDDARLADAMMERAAQHTDAKVQRNEPYGAEHGVTHTLKTHALPGKYLNVMLELRNDLIEKESTQIGMADMIAAWLVDAFGRTGVKGAVQCTA